MTDARGPVVYTARGPVEGEDWAAVAAVVNERMAARRIGQQELASLSGVSVSTLRQVQHGAGRRVQNKTLTAISRALGWPEGHLSQVLVQNRSHTEAPAHGQAVPDPVVGQALTTIEQQLREICERLSRLETLARREARCTEPYDLD